MSQARERATGRWGAREHSAPEVRIEQSPLNDWDPPQQARILQCLGNLTEIFGYINVLADAGEERFYAADGVFLGAAVGRLIQLGEQAGGLPRDFRELQGKTPNYTAMVGMRNKLAHEYEQLAPSLVWSTVARCRTHHSKHHAEVRRRYDARYDAQLRWQTG